MAKNPEVKKFFDIIRTALIGQPEGPSIKVIMTILGKEETLRRLEEAMKYVEEHK